MRRNTFADGDRCNSARFGSGGKAGSVDASSSGPSRHVVFAVAPPLWLGNQYARLASLHDKGSGVVFNAYPGYRVLHAAWCPTVLLMKTTTPKFAGAAANQAERWANDTYGPDGWKRCGNDCLADVR